ncbi:protein artichoke-like [Chironomus tepperi]|uniref:protein artichoke-like n=1 Tax=Chironomus tepperi TaxID=113505 RepID=UPI00391F7A85
MKFKVLILLLAAFSSTYCQSISCEYELRGEQYVCYLNVNNPNGYDNFTQIEGNHLPGYDDNRVTSIIKRANSVTRNVPQILCTQFPSTHIIDLSSLNIAEVSENSFRGCRSLNWLRLYENMISELPENLLSLNSRLNYLNIEKNLLETLPENFLENQFELENINMAVNPLKNLPAGLFRNVRKLRILYLRRGNLTALHPAWFENLSNLQNLDLSQNPLNQTIPADTFKNLHLLTRLSMNSCGIPTLNPLWFHNMTNLHYLSIYSNQLSTIPSNAFINSPGLTNIDFGVNRIREISPNAFTNLTNLKTLGLEYNQLTRLHSRWFDDKPVLNDIYLDFNQLTTVPVGVFSQLPSLTRLGLWGNRLRTIHRSSFGSLDRLEFLDVDDNLINSVDENFLRETRRLIYFYFDGNICASGWFLNFANNRDKIIREFERCIRNSEFVIERTTEAGSNYNFIRGFMPGMHVEVNSDEEVTISLTSFDVAWNPMVEIAISNQTVRITRSQVTQVAIVPSQGVFRPGAWNSFRIIWAKNVVLVFEDDEEFPFIAYTMEDRFVVNFIGLRSQRSRASCLKSVEMDIKVFIVLIAFIGSALSQSLSCNYALRQNSQYMCNLQINNPNGFDNFTQIEGFHYPGMNNVFVTAIVRNATGSISRNVPRVICSQFPHATFIDLSYLEIEDVDENAFRGCKNLDWLRLYNNRIARLPDNVFMYNRHLTYIDLERNLLTTLPENTFANQLALEALDLNNNPIANLPTGIFRNLWNLEFLYLRNTGISAVNSRWFDSLFNLFYFDMSNNNITQVIPNDAFRNLVSLESFDLSYSNIRFMNPEWFQSMARLHYVFMSNNILQTIPSNPFVNSPSIYVLDFGSNHIREISPNAFSNMPNLQALSLENNQLARLSPRWFDGKPHLDAIYLNANRITSVPVGIFSELPALRTLDLGTNNIRTIHRSSFGSSINLGYLNIEKNQINAVDESFLRDARRLTYLYFYDNVCGTGSYYDFANSIDVFIRSFERCIRNFGFVSERTTEAGSNYNFVQGMNPGSFLEISSSQEARVALTGFNIIWNPMLEIVFGSDLIRIVRNQDEDVAVVPNQNLFRLDAWNSYRITWVRNVISIFEGNDEFPFIAYTMRDFYPVNFMGLRSEHSQATWIIEPLRIPPPNQGPNPPNPGPNPQEA